MNPDTLKGIPLLRAMDEATLARLASVLEPRGFADGERIFAEGDPGDAMYFVRSGTVRIQKQTGAGAQKTLAILEPGDYFGEMALFDQQPRSASAIAAGTTSVLRLSTASFDELHRRAGQAGLAVLFCMIRTASERVRRLSAQVVVYDEIGKAIGESTSLDELLDVVLSQLCQATLADWGLIVLRSQFSDRLEIRAMRSLELSRSQKDAVTAGLGYLGPALRECEGQLLPQWTASAAFSSCEPIGFETFPLLLMAIAVEGQVLGLITLGGHEPGQFDLNDLNLARGVSRQAAQAILTARHREEELARARHGRQFVRF